MSATDNKEKTMTEEDLRYLAIGKAMCALQDAIQGVTPLDFKALALGVTKEPEPEPAPEPTVEELVTALEESLAPEPEPDAEEAPTSSVEALNARAKKLSQAGHEAAIKEALAALGTQRIRDLDLDGRLILEGTLATLEEAPPGPEQAAADPEEAVATLKLSIATFRARALALSAAGHRDEAFGCLARLECKTLADLLPKHYPLLHEMFKALEAKHGVTYEA